MIQPEKLCFVQFLTAFVLLRVLLGIDSHFWQQFSLSTAVYSIGNVLVFWAVTQAHEVVVGGCCFVCEYLKSAS